MLELQEEAVLLVLRDTLEQKERPGALETLVKVDLQETPGAQVLQVYSDLKERVVLMASAENLDQQVQQVRLELQVWAEFREVEEDLERQASPDLQVELVYLGV